MSTLTRTWWFLPLFTLGLGGLILVAFWLGDNPDDGVRSFVVMAIVAGVFAFGGRSETIRGLRGDGRDERFARIDLLATAAAGLVLITVVIGMCLWEWAHGRSGEPYTQLGAVTGVAYLVALIALRLRS